MFQVRRVLLSGLMPRTRYRPTPRYIRGCIICSKLHPSEGGGRFDASVRLQGGHTVHPGRAPLNHLHISDRIGVRGFMLPDGPQSHRGELSFPRCRHSPTYASADTLRGYYYYYYYYYCYCITSARVFWLARCEHRVRENAYKYVAGTPDGKTPLGRPKCTWKKGY